MTMFEIALCVLLTGLHAGLVAIWHELREMRRRAGLMPPKKPRLPDWRL